MSQTTPRATDITYRVVKSGLTSTPWAVAKTKRGDTSTYKVAFYRFKPDAVRDAATRNKGAGH